MSFDELVAITNNGLGNWYNMKNGNVVFVKTEETLGKKKILKIFFYEIL